MLRPLPAPQPVPIVMPGGAGLFTFSMVSAVLTQGTHTLLFLSWGHGRSPNGPMASACSPASIYPWSKVVLPARESAGREHLYFLPELSRAGNTSVPAMGSRGHSTTPWAPGDWVPEANLPLWKGGCTPLPKMYHLVSGDAVPRAFLRLGEGWGDIPRWMGSLGPY